MRTTIKLYVFISLVIATTLSGCRTIPMYTTVENLAKLKIGMDKSTVMNTLEIYPFDAFHADAEGCEIFLYKYKHEERKFIALFGDVETANALTAGSPRYVKPRDAYLVFRNKKLETVITDPGKGEYAALIMHNDAVEEDCDQKGKIKGCMDERAVNYDEDAKIEPNNVCVYCPKGYKINPELRDMPGINPCIPEDEECKPCDIIDQVIKQENGHLDIRLDLNDRPANQKIK